MQLSSSVVADNQEVYHLISSPLGIWGLSTVQSELIKQLWWQGRQAGKLLCVCSELAATSLAGVLRELTAVWVSNIQKKVVQV